MFFQLKMTEVLDGSGAALNNDNEKSKNNRYFDGRAEVLLVSCYHLSGV